MNWNCIRVADSEGSRGVKRGKRSIGCSILATLFSLIFALTGCRDSSPNNASMKPHQQIPLVLTDRNFHTQVVESRIPVLVDMWAPWCQPCIEMKPTIRQLATEFHGEVKVGELDVEDNSFIAEKYGVDRYPMLIVFVGGEEVERFVGPQTIQSLSHRLRQHVDGERM